MLCVIIKRWVVVGDGWLETLISHARDYCVMDVLPWVGLGGFVTCKAHLNIFI